MHDTLIDYYTELAPTWETRYAAPALKDELDELQDRVADLCEDHAVLELGCGTGFWTETLAYVAASIDAVDICPAMLAQAGRRGLDPEVVRFAEGDLYALPAGQFSAAFLGGLWAHVPRERQDAVLKSLRARLGPDGLVVLVDAVPVEGLTLPVARTDMDGNTWQIATAPSGRRYEILQNHPTDSALKKRFADHAREIRIRRGAHFWLLSCRLK
jgi:SAM-dependent methyltransferase